MNSYRFGYFLVLTLPWAAGLSAFGADGIHISDSVGQIRHTGLIWLMTLYAGAAILVMPRPDSNITFPWKTWFPFYFVCLTSLAWSEMGPDNVKLGAQMLVYPVVGIIASYTIRSVRTVERMNWMWSVNLVFIGLICCYFMLVLDYSPMEDSDDGKYRGFAARPAGASLMFLGCYFLAQIKRKPFLAIVGWSAAFVFCLISGGRAATALTLACWVTNPSIKIRTRWLTTGLVVIGAIGAFNTPIIQERFFDTKTGHAGSGKLEDVASGEFDGAGRFEAWPRIYEQAKRAPLYGHGLGRSIAFTFKVWYPMDKPHNEYLKVFFDSGGLGVVAFVGAILVTIAQLHWVSHQSNRRGIENWPASAAIMGLWGFAGLAIVDNPLVYGNNFTHPLFMMIGVAFSILHNERVGLPDQDFEEEPKTSPTAVYHVEEEFEEDELV